jgi:hypothetical protein
MVTVMFIFFIFILCSFVTSAVAGVYRDNANQIKNIYAFYDRHAHLDFLSIDIVKDRQKFHDLLKELIRNDDNILDSVNGYYHPAGFIKIVLYKGEKGEQMRFHFWGKGGKKAIQQEFNDGWEPLHNHRWNFSSKVISGELEMREFMDQDSRMRFNSTKEALLEKVKFNDTYKAYEVIIIPTRLKEEEDDYKINKTGRIALIGDCTSKNVSAGNSYYLDHRIPHQVKPAPKTSTLLLIDPPSKSFASEIFISENDQFQDEFKLIDLSQDDLKVHLAEFLQECESYDDK